jgi:hypothetical protein
LLRLALAAFDRMIGLELTDLAVDGAITKAPCGAQVAGRSPVDRGKQGMKRSVACDGGGLPLHLVAARANDHDSPLLEPTLAGICDMIGPWPDRPAMHLDRGYDSTKTRDLLGLGICWRSSATRPTSPPGACRRRSRPASGGRWNGCTRG